MDNVNDNSLFEGFNESFSFEYNDSEKSHEKNLENDGNVQEELQW